jgi:hypothetical protein
MIRAGLRDRLRTTKQALSTIIVLGIGLGVLIQGHHHQFAHGGADHLNCCRAVGQRLENR